MEGNMEGNMEELPGLLNQTKQRSGIRSYWLLLR
jgi:hypothetical protein